MAHSANRAEIIDFDAFRDQRDRAQAQDRNTFQPAYYCVWYPVWVMVPPAFSAAYGSSAQ